METVLFLAVISICPISMVVCNSADDWVRYISAPFEMEASSLKDPYKVNEGCTAALMKLKLEVDIKGSHSHLCVREDIWREHHPEHD